MSRPLGDETIERADPNTRIRAILAEHGGLGPTAQELSDETDLYSFGMSSRATVSVMLALEGAFEIEFPDEMLTRGMFASIASIRRAVHEVSSGRNPS